MEETEEPQHLLDLMGWVGWDRFLFASDYPHWDGDWPESTAHLRRRADISEDARIQIAGENARRFYRL